MPRMRMTIAIAAVVAVAFSILSPSLRAEPSASINDTARFIAGLPPSPGSPLTAYTNDGYWKQYARGFDEAWNNLEKRQLSKISAMVSRDFHTRQSVLFYFFSGPDFLYADAFFPSADTYVMAGLEPPGDIPDLRKFSRNEIATSLRALRSSLNSVLSYSFFQTKFMRVDFSRAKLNGTLPVLMTFLARSGKTIYDVSLFDLQSDGTLHPAEDKIANPTGKGVKIIFGDANVGRKRTLYYFSTDLSDGGIKTSGFLKFCDGLGHGDSFLKSASYLMHSDNFSTVRDYLLSHSVSLLQDDSGIPIRFFAQGWQLKPYGRYVGPISLFGGKYQAKLNEVFGKGRATPIDFSLGYRWRPRESNILLAIRDPSATAFEAAPAAGMKKSDLDSGDALGSQANADVPQRPKYRRHKEQTVNKDFQLFGYLP